MGQFEIAMVTESPIFQVLLKGCLAYLLFVRDQAVSEFFEASLNPSSPRFQCLTYLSI
jgi:hypothetical protein